MLGATPGGFVGAFTLQYLADLEVKLTLYSLVFVSAVYSLYRTAKDLGGAVIKKHTMATGLKDAVKDVSKSAKNLGGTFLMKGPAIFTRPFTLLATGEMR